MGDGRDPAGRRGRVPGARSDGHTGGGLGGTWRRCSFAALAIDDVERQRIAEAALVGALRDPVQRKATVDASLCHGTAGLARIAARMAEDAQTDTAAELRAYIPELLDSCAPSADLDAGCLEGHVGTALAAPTRFGGPATGWDSCLLIAPARGTWKEDRAELASVCDSLRRPVTAEHVAALHLGPALDEATVAARISDWWFIRKSPQWRLRCHADDTTAVTNVLSPLVAAGRIEAPTHGVYEPEALAFGGDVGMSLAHDLFHHDCRHLLTLLADEQPPLGRLETSMLLFGALLQGSGLDWFERGDVWCRVVQLRPSRPASVAPQLRGAMRKLLVADTANLPYLVPAAWAATFRGDRDVARPAGT